MPKSGSIWRQTEKLGWIHLDFLGIHYGHDLPGFVLRQIQIDHPFQQDRTPAGVFGYCQPGSDETGVIGLDYHADFSGVDFYQGPRGIYAQALYKTFHP